MHSSCLTIILCFYSDDAIKKNIDILNHAYQPSGVSFTLTDIKRVYNPDFFNYATANNNGYQDRMKSQLHQGNARTLNVYTVSLRIPPPDFNPNFIFLGYSSFPWEYQNNYVNDGVVLNYKSIPGTRVSYRLQLASGYVGFPSGYRV